MDMSELHGCAEQDPRYLRVRDELVAQATHGVADRLMPDEGVADETLDRLAETRSGLVRTSHHPSPLAALAAAPARLAAEAWPMSPRSAAARVFDPHPAATMHTVESQLGTTAHAGFYDDEVEPVLAVETGEIIRYVDTLSGFSGRVGPDTTVEELIRWREENTPWGPHTVVGPVFVRDAEPGDVVELRILHMQPIQHAVNYCMPGSLGTGCLPGDYPTGAIRAFELDLATMTTEFVPGVRIPLRPFPGILGVTAEQPGRHTSIIPGRFGGNLDLRELTVGSRLFLPVQRAGAGIWISDFHAAQGDGEVNLKAIETAAKEARIQVVLHKRCVLDWPFVETPTHWIALGLDPNLDSAFEICLRNVLKFLMHNVGFNAHEAYALAGVAVNFRVTQVVNRSRGVHAMLPKDLFTPQLRDAIPILVSATR